MNAKKAFLYLFVAIQFFLVSCKKKTEVLDSTAKCSSPTKADLEKIRIFPADHPLNMDISQAAIDPNSNAIISAIGAVGLHADFGSGLWQGAPIGIPYSVVCGNQTKVPITFRANSYDGNYGNESDPGPYPIPSTATIEGNGSGDSHVLTVDIENMKLYEMYNSSKSGAGWEASCGAVFDLKTTTYRPDGWTSADAAGLPILPCLIRYEEVLSGNIDHCIRFTLSKAKVYKGYIDPARHKVNGTGTLGTSLPMGAKLRLKSSFDITPYSPEVQTILKAMKTYGLILSDIGSDMFITGSPDSRWKDNDLSALKNVKASDFEVIKMGVVK
jgi:hypothetical protein